MRRFWLLLPVAAVVVLIWWAYQRRNEPPQVPFAKARRETLTSALNTNGKVEPIESEAVRAEKAGLIEKILVQPGDTVAAGAVLARLDETGLEAELQAAQARLAQARADLATIEAGGRGSELASIESSLARARFDRDQAQREYASLRRLAEKQAATSMDVASASAKVRQSELEIESLERRRATLVGKNDRSVAQSRIREAEAAVELARARIAQTVIRAPLGGVVYNLAVKAGAFLNVGDLVAEIGRLDRLRVSVYVDEPELGRVAVGQPVTITWTALPGQTWQGTVERKPTSIVALGSRQVGEVLCTIDNPGRELVPGTNVDAEIRTSVIQNALTIPKECLRRDANGSGVFVLRQDKVIWQPVTTGTSSITRVQITQGIAEGDSVALPTEKLLHNGERVTPIYP